MEHSMKLLQNPFERIKNGTKTVEFRLYDDKRKQIKIGDTIKFALMPDLQETITTEVLDLYRANTFAELFEKLFSDKQEIKIKLDSIHKIYSEEEEKKFGVLGIKIKLLN